jgi:hypothetical protein
VDNIASEIGAGNRRTPLGFDTAELEEMRGFSGKSE